LRPYSIIKKKRDGEKLDREQIAGFLDGYLAGEVPEYQMAALLMAVYFRGLDHAELAVWAERMLHSGVVLDLSDIPGVKVDKHSTGGVGDKISLPLAPLVAACGVRVPMISGRGLGHTGGTLDKLESIPGFDVNLSIARYRELVADLGLCLIGQTADLAPLDRRLYALRDVTATVDSVPLISSSIMSKKLAEGIDALVLDVKVGSGAFMKTVQEARVLAETMVGIGRQMGKRVVALLTNMDQPLGRMVGNALEVRETIDVLRGGGPDDIVELTLELGAHMLVLGDAAADRAEALAKMRTALDDGSALARFRALVEAQGGDVRTIDEPDLLPRAKQTQEVVAKRSGCVQAIDTEKVGHAAVALGAGRLRVDSPVLPEVGIEVLVRLGDTVTEGQPLVVVHSSERSDVERATELVHEAYDIGAGEAVLRPLVLDVVS